MTDMFVVADPALLIRVKVAHHRILNNTVRTHYNARKLMCFT